MRIMLQDEEKLKRKRRQLLAALCLVAALFVLRGILFATGALKAVTKRTPRELQDMLPRTEVRIGTGDASAPGCGGFLLDAFKSSTKEENFTVYLATSKSALKRVTDDVYDTLRVTTSQGDLIDPEVVSISEDEDVAILRGALSEEAQAPFSRDALARENAGDFVYYLLADGTLKSGSYIRGGTGAKGARENFMSFTGDFTKELSGGGVYTEQGYLLGMMIQSDAGTVQVLPADRVEHYYYSVKEP